jgi:hypothetical protein
MGSEALCTARASGKVSKGKAYLETDELIFRGDFRLAIAYKDIRSVRAKGPELLLELAGETVRLELGALAAKWAEKIAHPRTRAEKLGLKPGQRVAIVGLDDAAFESEVRKACDDVSLARPKRDSDAIFLGLEDARGLGRIAGMVPSLKPEGALWTVRPKGRADVSESQVAEAAYAAGLVDVKVVRFSDTHTAEKFVIPVAQRPKKKKPAG